MLCSRHIFGSVCALAATLVRDDAFGQLRADLIVPPGVLRSADEAASQKIARGGSTPTPRPSPAHLDHFMAYAAKPAKDTAAFVPLGPVSLPRLGGGPYDLVKVGKLLLPADKNDEGVRDEATHLVEYGLKPSKGTRKLAPLTGVRVTNQCSDMLVELTKPVAALVPTAKSLVGPVTAPADPPVDHLLCFAAKLQKKGPDGAALPKFPKGIQVEVADQFQSRRYELTKPTRLCVPTDKSGSPVFLKGAAKGTPAALAPATVQHGNEHLLCYKAKLATTEIAQAGCGPATPGDKGTKIPKQAKHAPRTGVFVANQLGALRLDTTKEVELCIPSFTDLPFTEEPFTTLPGDPQQPVSAVTSDVLQPPGWTDAELTLDASEARGPAATGARFLRTRLGIFFTNEATVGQANALLARLGAQVTAMIDGVPYAVVRIPDPGDSLQALQNLAANVGTNPAVASVHLDTIPEPDLLPPDFPRPEEGNLGDKPALLYIDHLLQARAPAAWNARNAIKLPPALVIADAFGGGQPGASFTAQYPAPGDFATGRPHPILHGYQVLSVIAAAFGSPNGPANCFESPAGQASAGCATGVYPGSPAPLVRAADLQRLSANELEIAILLAVKDSAPLHAVVNASLGRPEMHGNIPEAKKQGQRWFDLVVKANLQNEFLLVSAAGNISEGRPNVRDAETHNPFNAAALIPELSGPEANIKNLENVLIVENRTTSRFPFRPGGLHQKTKTGGNISACGTDVWTLVQSAQMPNGWTGTSLAAAQVAGVAAYVWAIEPELEVEDVKDLLLRNAQPQGGSTRSLDAYATVVDIDRATRPPVGVAPLPVRQALLDIGPLGMVDGTLDAEDVLVFFDNFYDLTPDKRRYGEGDLRAAYEPQTDSVRFDLNANGSIDNPVTLRVGFNGTTNAPVSMNFNEESVATDADIMCYEAFRVGPYQKTGRVDPGRNRCCTHYMGVGRLPPNTVCTDECPVRPPGGRRRDVVEEPKPVGHWRLSVPSGLVVYDFWFLEDGTVMIPWVSGSWEKGGTWTSTPHEVEGDIPYYDVRIDACTGLPNGMTHTRYSFEGTWSPRPLTDCFGVTSCFNGDACPAMQGMLTTSDGTTSSQPGPVNSQRVTGIDGWEQFQPPLDNCYGECFQAFWRSGPLACTPVGALHCLGTTAPACGGVCPRDFTCTDVDGSCTCVTAAP